MMTKHSLNIEGRPTSIRLESEFWFALEDEAHRQGVSVARLVSEIAADQPRNLASAVRCYVLARQSGGIPAA